MVTKSSSRVNYYAALGVTKEATPNEIKKAYHKKALLLHPDKTGGTTTEEFKIIQEANATLSDPEKRKLYDTFGGNGVKMAEKFNLNEDMMEMVASGAKVLAAVVIGLWWVALCLFAFLILLIIKIDLKSTIVGAALGDAAITPPITSAASPSSNASDDGWGWTSWVFLPVWFAYVALVPLSLTFIYLAGRNLYWIAEKKYPQLFAKMKEMRRSTAFGGASTAGASRRSVPTSSTASPAAAANSSPSVDDIDDDGSGETSCSVPMNDMNGATNASSSEINDDGGRDEEKEDSAKKTRKTKSVANSCLTITSAVGYLFLYLAIIYLAKALDVYPSSSTSPSLTATTPDFLLYWDAFVFYGLLALLCEVVADVPTIVPTAMMRKIRRMERKRNMMSGTIPSSSSSSDDNHEEDTKQSRKTRKSGEGGGGYRDTQEEVEDEFEEKFGVKAQAVKDVETHYAYAAVLGHFGAASGSNGSGKKNADDESKMKANSAKAAGGGSGVRSRSTSADPTSGGVQREPPSASSGSGNMMGRSSSLSSSPWVFLQKIFSSPAAKFARQPFYLRKFIPWCFNRLCFLWFLVLLGAQYYTPFVFVGGDSASSTAAVTNAATRGSLIIHSTRSYHLVFFPIYLYCSARLVFRFVIQHIGGWLRYNVKLLSPASHPFLSLLVIGVRTNRDTAASATTILYDVLPTRSQFMWFMLELVFLRLYTVFNVVRVIEAFRVGDTSSGFIFGVPSALRSLFLLLLLLLAVLLVFSCLCTCASAFLAGRGDVMVKFAMREYAKRAGEGGDDDDNAAGLNGNPTRGSDMA